MFPVYLRQRIYGRNVSLSAAEDLWPDCGKRVSLAHFYPTFIIVYLDAGSFSHQASIGIQYDEEIVD